MDPGANLATWKAGFGEMDQSPGIRPEDPAANKALNVSFTNVSWGTVLSLSGLKWVALLLFVAVMFLAGLPAGNSALGSSTTTTTIYRTITITQTVTQTIASMTTSTATTGWREIKRFTGSVGRTTEPFNVPVTMWRIRWSYSSSQATVFGFFVYQVGQITYVESVSSYTAGASSVTYIYKGQADFYLSIITHASYEIVIEVPG